MHTTGKKKKRKKTPKKGLTNLNPNKNPNLHRPHICCICAYAYVCCCCSCDLGEQDNCQQLTELSKRMSIISYRLGQGGNKGRQQNVARNQGHKCQKNGPTQQGKVEWQERWESSGLSQR